MTKTIFEEMGGTYVRQGEYLIPCLTLPAEKEQPIGLFGQRHLRYLFSQIVKRNDEKYSHIYKPINR